MSEIHAAELPAHLSVQTGVFMLTDIIDMLSVIRELGDETRSALFLDGYYSLCSTIIGRHGGEVIKYEGDASLSMFPEDAIQSAIAALVEIRASYPAFCRDQQVKTTDIKGVVHMGEAIVGSFGPEKVRDVLGKTINTLFSMDSRGITLSEKVYRKLPSDQRGPFRKHGGRVTYTMK